MPSRARRTAGVAAMLLAAAGCGGRRPRLTAGSTRHSDVSDPIGDARPVPDYSTPPDLVHGTVDVVDRNITFTIQFAPGTFDRTSTRVTIQLDTDEVQSTGIQT